MQLVYFNDLHKNLGCNRGITSKNSIIPVTFPVLPAKFYALRLLSVPFFFCPLSPSADKRPVGTDISIAQKTCVFRPVDISVACPQAQQSDISICIQTAGRRWRGYPFRLLTAFAATFPKGTANSLSQSLTALPAPSGREPTLSVIAARCHLPRKGEVLLYLPAEAEKLPLRGSWHGVSRD